jgi:hypothetical protein
VAVTTEGRREIIGLGLGPSEAEPFWSTFLKGLVKRGLKGVKLVISDAHDGLRHAITRVLGVTWQRCRVHWMRNALAHVPKGQHPWSPPRSDKPFFNPMPRPRSRPGGTLPIGSGRGGPSSRRAPGDKQQASRACEGELSGAFPARVRVGRRRES